MTFYDTLKNIFMLLLVLQFAPSALENIKKQYIGYINPTAKVGVIPVSGLISSSDYINKHLNKYFKDPSIKAILLKIESPGGSSGSSQAIHDEIKALQAEHTKPIVALVENVCASGSYYIASAADYIVSPGQALIGSIGTYFPYLFQLKDLREEYKVGYAPIKAGIYKTLGDPLMDRTPEETALLQSVADDAYAQFTKDIAINRKLSLTTTATWAEGKIFSGRQAQEIGLIDYLGSAHTAQKILKEKALIDGDIEWVHPPQETGLARLFGGSQGPDRDSMFNSLAEKLYTALRSQYAKQSLHLMT